jgi:hypothetical protein
LTSRLGTGKSITFFTVQQRKEKESVVYVGNIQGGGKTVYAVFENLSRNLSPYF